MIKKLRLKFVLVFLVLVVSVFITSSCYASEEYTYKDFVITIDKEAGTYHIINTTSNVEFTYDISSALDRYDYYYFVVNDYNKYSSIYSEYVSIDMVFSNGFSWYNGNSFYSYTNSSAWCACLYYYVWSSNGTAEFSHPYSSSGRQLDSTTYNELNSYMLVLKSDSSYYYSNTAILTASNIITAPNGTVLYEPGPEVYVDVTHEFQSDTSAKVTFDYSSYGTDYVLKYSLSGVEINTDLTAPVTLKNPVVYSPGVTNLVVAPNTKVYWVLYDSLGDSVETDVYQIPEYDSVIENSDKKIEYEIVYSEDYTSATLNANLVNGAFSDKLVYSEFNAINSATGTLDYGYQAFLGSLTLYKNGSIYLYALDSFGNVLDVNVVKITDVFNFKSSDFSYSLEDNSTLHGGYKLIITPRVKNWSSQVNVMYTVTLNSGDELAYVSIDTEFPDLSYVNEYVGNTTFTGRIASGDTIIINGPSNQFENLNGSINFKIYKKSDNTLIFDKSYSFNVEAFSSGNISGGSAGDFTGSLPSGSDNSGDFGFNDYGDVTWTDVTDYISVNGSFWQAVKSILNCFPKWITSPIFFLISAIVAVAIIKAVLPG